MNLLQLLDTLGDNDKVKLRILADLLDETQNQVSKAMDAMNFAFEKREQLSTYHALLSDRIALKKKKEPKK